MNLDKKKIVHKKHKKHIFMEKAGRPVEDLTGKIYGGWKVIESIGRKDGIHNFWKLESPDKKEIILMRQDKLKKFKGKRLDRIPYKRPVKK